VTQQDTQNLNDQDQTDPVNSSFDSNTINQNLINVQSTKNETDEQVIELIEMESGSSNQFKFTEQDQNQVKIKQTDLDIDVERQSNEPFLTDLAQFNNYEKETNIDLPSFDYAGDYNEFWILDFSSDPIIGGDVSLLLSITGKDQGWGNQKSKFAITVDTLSKSNIFDSIGEWSTFTYDGMLDSFKSPVFDHDWTI